MTEKLGQEVKLCRTSRTPRTGPPSQGSNDCVSKYGWLTSSVSNPDLVGSAFNLGLDPGSGSVFGIRIQVSKKKILKAKIYYD